MDNNRLDVIRFKPKLVICCDRNTDHEHTKNNKNKNLISQFNLSAINKSPICQARRSRLNKDFSRSHEVSLLFQII
jgi:hypothetical protein